MLAAPLAAHPAASCGNSDEGAALTRRLVARVKYLPGTEAWEARMSRERAAVRYALLLDEPRRIQGRCHWVVEVRAGDRLWKRFLVPGEGGTVIELPHAGPH